MIIAQLWIVSTTSASIPHRKSKPENQKELHKTREENYCGICGTMKTKPIRNDDAGKVKNQTNGPDCIGTIPTDVTTLNEHSS